MNHVDPRVNSTQCQTFQTSGTRVIDLIWVPEYECVYCFYSVNTVLKRSRSVILYSDVVAFGWHLVRSEMKGFTVFFSIIAACYALTAVKLIVLNLNARIQCRIV